MTVQKFFINKLKDFGINNYEARLWSALLSKGIATAGELSDIANVPRSRTYDVLESLERKGFIILKLGKPIKYIAIPPSEVLERVKKNIKEEAERQSISLENLHESKILQDLNKLHKSALKTIEPTELTGMIRGTDNLIHHHTTLLRNAQESIFITTTEEGILYYYNYLYTHLKKAKERNIKIEIIIPQTPTTEKIAPQFNTIATIRFTEQPIGNFIITDQKTTSIALLDHTEHNLCIWINTPFISQSFTTLFTTLWPALETRSKTII